MRALALANELDTVSGTCMVDLKFKIDCFKHWLYPDS